MKNIYSILLIIIISVSCSTNLADKRVHRKGYHFRGMAFQHNTLKSREKNENEPMSTLSNANTVKENVSINRTSNINSRLLEKLSQDSFPQRDLVVASKNRSVPTKKISHVKRAETIDVLNSKPEIDIQLTHYQNKPFKKEVYTEKNELQTKSIVLSSIAGFFTVLGSLVFFKRKKVYNHVKSKTLWASKNKAKARWFLGASHVGLLASSLTAGWLLKDMGLGFSSFGMNELAIGTSAAFLGSRMIGKGKSFARKKISFAVMPVTAMLLAIGFGGSNQFNNRLEGNQFANTSFATIRSMNNQEVFHASGHEELKDKSPKERDDIITIIIKTILIALALTVAFTLLYAITILGCTLLCSDLVILGWLTMILGSTGVVVGLSFLVWYIIEWKKKVKVEKNSTKKIRSKNHLFKKLFFPILFVIGLFVSWRFFGFDF